MDRVRTGGWRGEAVLCDIWYEPVAGYDPEDYPSERELSQPLRIWLAPIEGGRYFLPVRLYTRAGLGGVTIELAPFSDINPSWRDLGHANQPGSWICWLSCRPGWPQNIPTHAWRSAILPKRLINASRSALISRFQHDRSSFCLRTHCV